MATIKKYVKADGSQAYMFQAYLGVDSLTGKKKRTTRRGFRTAKEAKLALAQLQLEVESNSFVKQDFSSFKDIYELWFENYKLSVKPSTSLRVTCLFDNQILPKFGSKRINKINVAYCQNVINEWNEKGAPSRLRSYTKKVFNYALSKNLIQYNPMDRILIPRTKEKERTKESNFFDKLRLKEFLEDVKQNDEAFIFLMFHVLAYTGLRKGELAALYWSDIDFSTNSLTVSKTGYYLDGEAHITTTKTTNSSRTISIDVDTASLLKKWKFEQKKYLLSRGVRVKKEDSQFVFSNNKNELLRNTFLNDVLRNYAEYSITPHGFRHTHASLLFEAGASIKQVQERLGHNSINTTLEIYTHVTKEAEKETADKFLNYMKL
ncbi:site-specific integrase [uncultured Enterococcus sp.]|uniref:site-specific integrase n=1 Tax=uncultured Enterococcus sp. TaxID=167972 RepID=UPI002AA943A4|nr:site-specific integrase [uncultured Enterococcus sp.]